MRGGSQSVGRLPRPRASDSLAALHLNGRGGRGFWRCPPGERPDRPRRLWSCTFEQLDGEGILLDGVCWQARADGSLIQAPHEEAIPFWVATHFQAEHQMRVSDIGSIADLGGRIDPVRPGANLFVAIKIQGLFEQVEMRTVSRVPEGMGLLEASKNQTMVRLEKVSGTLVGFWSPAHTTSLNIPGYHFHFLSDDHGSGGHVLDVKADSLNVELDFQSNLRLALPETKQFLEADLSRDISEELHQAEGVSR